MTGESEPIFWRGQLVGHILDPRRLPAAWRGRWSPMYNEYAEQFLALVGAGAAQWVEYGSGSRREMARVEQAPGKEIELIIELVDESGTLFVSPLKPDEPDQQD